MCKRNKGFFLPELLLSLSAWLVIATVFFPLIMNLVNQSIRLHQEFEGTKALYETLLKAKKENQFPVAETISINQTLYEIYLESSEFNAGAEVCIKYVDVFKKGQKKCEIYE